MKPPARGEYRYFRDGQRQDIREPWEFSAGAEGQRLTGQRWVRGVLMLEVCAQYRGNDCVALELDWHAPARRVRYQLDGARLTWSEQARETQAQIVPQDSLLFPLLRAATGFTLPRLAERERCVVVPDLRNPADPDFLQPLKSVRRAERLPDEPPLSHYRYFGGEYGEAGADYWLDQDGLVVRYRWASPNGVWIVER